MKKLPVLYVVIAGLAWGSAALFVAFLTSFGFNSFQLASVRCTVGAVMAMVFALGFNRKNLKITLLQGLSMLVAGVSFFAMAAFYYMAIKESSPSTAGVLLYLAPIIVLAFSATFWGERITVRKGIAVCFMLIGCALVTGIIGGMRFAWKGIIFALLSCVSYAVNSICVSLAGRQGASPSAITMYSFLVASIISFFASSPVALVSHIASVPWYAIIVLILFGFINGFVASFFFSKAMKVLPAGIVSSMSAIEPLTVTVTSVLFLEEKLTLFSVIGIIMILASVVMLSLEKK